MRVTVLRFDSLPSTNTEAASQARLGAPEGLSILARQQTKGRGRLSRKWSSPADAGLYFSILLRPKFQMSRFPLVTLMAAIAVSEALLEACGLGTDIKWPNDIEVNEKKLCGILAETVETESGRAIVLGIGINLREGSFPPDLHGIATSVEGATGEAPDAEQLLEYLTGAIEKWYLVLRSPNGDRRIVEAWSSRSSYAQGKRVRVSFGNENLEGITRGLELDGALRIETSAGDIRLARAGDVTSTRRDVD
jgi:BirA family biotin operon repressor/biotin-[acetyl-CoA-carboxylase] ligase